MVARMKTTITLPDSLAQRAKEVARTHHLTLRELVTEGLRAEVERLSTSPQSTEFHFFTRGGAGLQPGVEVASLVSHAYDLSS